MAHRWVSNATAQRILNVVQYAYPVVLLFVFLCAFTIRSVLVARAASASEPAPDDSPNILGPGGKILPRKRVLIDKAQTAFLDFSRPRKLLFNWLSVAATATFFANSVNVLVHALVARQENWWCGQAAVVSRLVQTLSAISNSPLLLGLLCRLIFRL